MQDDILRFVEPVFRFCLKRLSSRSDAEDLSQEILLHAIQGINRGIIENTDAYVWRIAHNRYARTMDNRSRNAVVYYGHSSLLDIPDDSAEEADTQPVFKALHTLSAMYRDILVAYYVRGKDVKTIAREQSVSVETVKWRLHAGREKIRGRLNESMEKTYEKIKMHVACNGYMDPGKYLHTQVYKAIAMACYESPLTIEEVSIATGIPTLYLEEALEHMFWGDAVEKVNGKYAANFIITNTEQRKKMNTFLSDSIICDITDSIWQFIHENEKTLRDINFYGSDFPLSHLMHVLVPSLVYHLYEKSMEKSILPFYRDFPRKDGGFGWFIVNEGIEGIDEYTGGCNEYHYDNKGGQPGRFIHYVVGGRNDLERAAELDKILRGSARFYLNAIGPEGACSFDSDEEAAKALSSGLCMNKNRLYPSVPVFTPGEYELFNEWTKKCAVLNSFWDKWVETLFKEYKSFTPKRLAGQIGGNVSAYANNLYAFVLKEMQKRGLADKPDRETTFTKNILLIR